MIFPDFCRSLVRGVRFLVSGTPPGGGGPAAPGPAGRQRGRPGASPAVAGYLLLSALIGVLLAPVATASAMTLLAPRHDYPAAGPGILELCGDARPCPPASAGVAPSVVGTISTVAGSGEDGFSGDGGPATAARLGGPSQVALDQWGNLFIADRNNHRVRKVDADGGVIATVAGNGTPWITGDGSTPTDDGVGFPSDVAVDAAGNLYISDIFNSRILKVSPDGVSSTVAGSGISGDFGDGGPAVEAGLNVPTGVAVDNRGNLFIADSNNHRIRRLDLSSGIITTVVGNGTEGFSGDGGPATGASLNLPTGVAVDTLGNLYIADTLNSRIRKVDAHGTITTVAGRQDPGFSGDGGAATQARLNRPTSAAPDTHGNLFIADSNNHRIRKVGADGVITTVTVSGEAGFSGDGGPATEASLNLPTGVVVDGGGDLFIADRHNHRVRRVSLVNEAPGPAPTPTATPAPTVTPAPVAPSPAGGGGGGGGTATGGGGLPPDPAPGPLPVMPLPATPVPVEPAAVAPASPLWATPAYAPNPTITPAPTPTEAPAATATPTPTVPAPAPAAWEGGTGGGSGSALGAVLLVAGLFMAGGLIGLTALGAVYLTQTGRIQWSRKFWSQQYASARVRL